MFKNKQYYISNKPDRQFYQEKSEIESDLYKNIEYRDFIIKGLYHRDEDVLMRSLSFYGYAKCENNSHDRYAVGIYNNYNELVGYTPRGNKKLYNSIQEWHGGKVIFWGGIDFNDYYDTFKYRFTNAGVTIPVGFSSDELDIIHAYLIKKSYWYDLYNSYIETERPVDKGEKLLNVSYEIEKISKNLRGNYFEGQFPGIPLSMIPSISNRMEKNKDWKGLINLKKFRREIEKLSAVKKNATIRRIEKAEEILTE